MTRATSLALVLALAVPTGASAATYHNTLKPDPALTAMLRAFDDLSTARDAIDAEILALLSALESEEVKESLAKRGKPFVIARSQSGKRGENLIKRKLMATARGLVVEKRHTDKGKLGPAQTSSVTTAPGARSPLTMRSIGQLVHDFGALERPGQIIAKMATSFGSLSTIWDGTHDPRELPRREKAVGPVTGDGGDTELLHAFLRTLSDRSVTDALARNEQLVITKSHRGKRGENLLVRKLKVSSRGLFAERRWTDAATRELGLPVAEFYDGCGRLTERSVAGLKLSFRALERPAELIAAATSFATVRAAPIHLELARARETRDHLRPRRK